MPLIQSLDRALRIVDLFDERTPELKITEISARMNLHKSTVHSLLKTLQEHRYIAQNPDNGKYRLGMKMLERASIIMQSLDIRSLSRDVLVELTRSTGQTAHLVILEGTHGVYIDKVEGKKAVIRYSSIGGQAPVHSSAVGKALLAFKSPDEIKKILAGYRYEIHTANTISSEGEFLKELAKVRENGYSIDAEENEPGVQCCAVPIRDYSGEVVAAISLAMLKASVDEEEFKSYLSLLRAASRTISESLGYGVLSV